jgi:phosphoglycolate phosphatase-like HAD superfamily hydrolase
VRLFLFDIDGTLISSRGVGRRALARALEDTYGTRGTLDQYDTRGKTDRRIVVEALRAAGLRDEVIQAKLDGCLATYVRELGALIGPGECVTALPGMVDVVRALSARADAVVGLLTGNVAAGAELKLRPTALALLSRGRL